MTLDLSTFARALHGAIEVDEFIASETRSHVATLAIGAGASRSEAQPYSLQAQIFADRKRGRGAANLVPLRAQALLEQIQEASTRAHGALGPSWQLPPAAAPARVSVFEATTDASSHHVARFVLAEFEKALPSTVRAHSATVRVQHSTHSAILSNGFDNQYLSADIEIRAVLQADGGVAVPLHANVRRLRGLSDVLAKTLARVRERSILDAGAQPAAPGLVDVVLLHSAYLPREASDYGIWTPLVRQADATRVRSGMSTHTPGRALLAPSPRGEALSIRSEGTKPYALRSAPFTRDGQAVRNFTLVEQGVATGVSIDHRESALGAGPANGGVRRLVVSAGSETESELGRPATRPLLYVRALEPVRVSGNGCLYLEIASGELRTRDALGAIQAKQIRSAILCGQLRDWLHDAYFSRETEDDSWLAGPRALRFDKVRIH